MIMRILVWGIVFAVGGAFLWSKNSYDSTGTSTLTGAIAGLLIGVAVGLIVHIAHKLNRRDAESNQE